MIVCLLTCNCEHISVTFLDQGNVAITSTNTPCCYLCGIYDYQPLAVSSLW